MRTGTLGAWGVNAKILKRWNSENWLHFISAFQVFSFSAFTWCPLSGIHMECGLIWLAARLVAAPFLRFPWHFRFQKQESSQTDD